MNGNCCCPFLLFYYFRGLFRVFMGWPHKGLCLKNYYYE